MAEVVALVASIVALTEAGFKISKAVSHVAGENGTAGAQIKGIGTDTRAISLILREITKRLNRVRSVSTEVRDVAADIVALCKIDIEDIEELLTSLQPMQGSDVSIKQKTKWLFVKSKASLRRASLDSLKLTLGLFVHTLEFIECGEIDENIKDEVDILMIQSSNTKRGLLNAEHTDQKAEMAYQVAAETQTLEHLQTESGTAPDRGVTSPTSIRANPAMEIELYSAEDMESDQDTQKQHYDPQASLLLMQSMSDDHFLLIARHLQVQKLASHFALSVMNAATDISDSETPRSTEYQAFLSSTAHRRAGIGDFLRPGAHGSSPATPIRTGSNDLRHEGNSQRNSHPRNTRSRDSSKSGSKDLRPREKLLLGYDVSQRDGYPFAKPQDWYPITLSRDWKEMQQSIHETTIGLDLPHFVDAIEEGRYVLFDSENVAVFPDIWAEMVKPDMRLTMHITHFI